MAFNVDEIVSQLALGGARSSHFQVTLTNPVNGNADLKSPFMIKAAQVPDSTLGEVLVPYMGRSAKLAGDRVYADWTTTVINDEDYLVRNALEEWSNAINSPQGNVSKLGSASPLLYKSTAEVVLLSKTGAPVRKYKLHGLWPKEISAIDMAWENENQISEFTVTWAYDWHEISGGVTGNAGGN